MHEGGVQGNHGGIYHHQPAGKGDQALLLNPQDGHQQIGRPAQIDQREEAAKGRKRDFSAQEPIERPHKPAHRNGRTHIGFIDTAQRIVIEVCIEVPIPMGHQSEGERPEKDVLQCLPHGLIPQDAARCAFFTHIYHLRQAFFFCIPDWRLAGDADRAYPNVYLCGIGDTENICCHCTVKAAKLQGISSSKSIFREFVKVYFPNWGIPT